jgi:hypothetical protein
MSLKDRIEGAPNFRRIPVKELGSDRDHAIVGVAIPTLVRFWFDCFRKRN